jgi:broad specificity phosphatase PhoE
MAVVLLVRHGQASFGADDYDVLSTVGERQAEVVAGRLGAMPRLDRVVTGAMVRQRGTAAPLAAARPEVPVTEDARFDEYDHVELLRRSTADDGTDLDAELAAAADPRRTFQQVFDRAVARWTGGAHHDYHESHAGFRARVRTGLGELFDDLDRSGTAVVVTSGGVIAAVCADLLGLDAGGWTRLNRVIVNTSVTKLVRGRRGTNLVTVNDHAHLEPHGRELLTYR